METSKSLLDWEWNVPPGWVELLRETDKLVESALNSNESIIYLDVKEKYGCLTIYYVLESEDQNRREIFDKIFRDAYEKSRSICCICGAPAEFYTTGWISYYCAAHIDYTSFYRVKED